MGWRICPTTRSSTALKCHWLLFNNAVNCPSISLAPRILLGQCSIHRAEMGGKWRQREKSKEPMTSERPVEDCVGWVPGSSWWVRTGSWLVSFIEKGSKALWYDRRKMGDLVLGWQRFFCATGGSQGHSRGFVVAEKMIETWLKLGNIGQECGGFSVSDSKPFRPSWLEQWHHASWYAQVTVLAFLPLTSN